MSKYFIGAAIALAFMMGMYTCKTFHTCKECPPAFVPLEGGRIVDSDTVTHQTRDSAKTPRPEPERITLPTLAEGQAPAPFYKPVPVYMPADTGAIIEQYNALYEDYVTLKEYDNDYYF